MIAKQYILDEIRRTARENGGAALGRNSFHKETGIKITDWNKYWPRFGDAVREAGLVPNELQAAYDENFLIEKFIAFTRELKRLPVEGELRIKARNDASFPSQSVFRTRLGTKQQRAARILAFCSARTGYDDVIPFFTAEAHSTPVVEKNPDGIDENETFGFVYLIKSGRYFKIGRSNAAGRREREIALQLPERANTVHVIRTDDPPGIESYWHRRFAEKRKNGEWFELTSADIIAFRRRKFM